MKKLSLLLAVITMILVVFAVSAEKLFDETPRLVIFSAFSPEKTVLVSHIEDPKEVLLLGRTFVMGKIFDIDVLVGLTGVSMTNASMMTQAVIDHFNVKEIIFSGIAGGVNPELNIGDVVIPSEWAEYQEMYFQRELESGVFDEPEFGNVDLPNYGMMFPQTVGVTTKSGNPDEETHVRWFSVDETLFSYAQQIPADTMTNCAGVEQCLSNETKLKIGGRGVDGPTFVDNAEFREWVWETFTADCLSMETAAIAHVCYVNEIPFLGFRSLSDLAGGGPNANEIGLFFQIAANNSANVLLEFVRIYSEAQ